MSSDSSTLTWCNTYFPGFPFLNEYNVLEYFCDPSNPFFNVKSINHQFLSQNLSFDLISSYINECTYYSFTKNDPRLYIITEYHRSEGRKVPDEPISYFYILDGVVYQAPALYDVIDSRIQNCTTELEKVQIEMQDHLKYSVNGTHTWQFPGDEIYFKLQREAHRDEYSILELPVYPVVVQEHVIDLIQQLEHETYVKIKEKQDLELEFSKN